jgi:hypothetical protein
MKRLSPSASTSRASLSPSELARSVFAAVTAKMMLFGFSINLITISLICFSISFGWSPTGTCHHRVITSIVRVSQAADATYLRHPGQIDQSQIEHERGVDLQMDRNRGNAWTSRDDMIDRMRRRTDTIPGSYLSNGPSSGRYLGRSHVGPPRSPCRSSREYAEIRPTPLEPRSPRPA